MKNIFTITLMAISITAGAQVGINNTDPKAQLDISAGTVLSEKDGILIPRVDEFPIGVGADQDGMMVFLTGNGAPDKGFYFWDELLTTWINVGGGENNWGLDGNTGTNASSNFIGTTDSQDLTFRTNNLEKMRLSQKGQLEFTNTGSSIFIGSQAGENDDLSANSNTFIGDRAGLNTTEGFNNVALGASALRSNLTGDFNSAVGTFSLVNLTTGNTNSAMGFSSLNSLTTGISNVAIGGYSLYDNISGNHNVAVGTFSLYQNTGSFNTAVGSSALYSNTTGSSNVSIGGQSLTLNTTGGFNVAVGYNSMSASLTSTRNIALGYNSMASNENSSDNVALGAFALNTANPASTPGRNTAVGSYSFRNVTTSIRNTGLGYHSGFNTTTGQGNTAIGSEALYNNQTGVNNVAIGYNAGRSPAGISVTENIYLGYQSGRNNTGNNNMLQGSWSGQDASGDRNIMVGQYAGRNVTGDDNILLGRLAGDALVIEDALIIENSGVAGIDNALVYGEFDTNIFRINGEIQVGNPSGTGYRLPATRGTASQVLTSNGTGFTSWTTITPPTPSIVNVNTSNFQAIPSIDTWALILFDSENIDSNAEFDITTSQFTVTTAGYYRIYTQVGFPNDDSVDIGLFVNSNLVAMNLHTATSSLGIQSKSIDEILLLNANDVVEIQAKSPSGTGAIVFQGTLATNPRLTTLQIQKID